MSEFEWIDRYLKPLATSSEAMGLENDVAILRSPSSNGTAIVTMDTIVEGIHFLTSDPLDTVSRKLVRINVSDVICKGGVPEQALLSMALPAWFGERDMHAFTHGLSADLDIFGINLIGGDIVSTTGPLVLSLTLTAESGPAGPTTRSGARPEDLVYVSGRIGLGVIGLEAAQSGDDDPLVSAYRVPPIQDVKAANLVSRFASASIDVSDGLISEAMHICQASSCGMRIDLDRVVWGESDPSLPRMLELATAGDDYQVLMTVRPDRNAEFKALAADSKLVFSPIGHIENGNALNLYLEGQSVELPTNSGFKHAR